MIDTIDFQFQDPILAGSEDAQLVMQKLSTLPENNDKIKYFQFSSGSSSGDSIVLDFDKSLHANVDA